MLTPGVAIQKIVIGPYSLIHFLRAGRLKSYLNRCWWIITELSRTSREYLRLIFYLFCTIFSYYVSPEITPTVDLKIYTKLSMYQDNTLSWVMFLFVFSSGKGYFRRAQGVIIHPSVLIAYVRVEKARVKCVRVFFVLSFSHKGQSISS